MSTFKRIKQVALASALTATLAACATPTPYRPAMGSGSSRTGYAEQQIEPDRFQVMFAGNSVTSRETVERYLLYRSAQLTLEQGYDHFVLANRDTDKQSRTVVNDWGGPGFGAFGGGFGYWGPRWRFGGPRWGVGAWSPWYDPFWDRQIDVRTINKYEAMAEIVMGKGPKPGNDVRAFDARAVVQSLGPTVRMPTAG
ncbi:CC0125/CC1285 family lipoprotein [Sphingomonas sp. CJ99]